MSRLTDGNYSVEARTGGKRITYPFDGDNVSFFTEQDWTQDRVNFMARPLNEPDLPDDPLAFLVGETPLQDLGGGFSRWTRIHARVPVARNEFESFAYTFHGFGATLSSKRSTPWEFPSGATASYTSTDDPGRVPLARKVTSRMAHVYYLTGAGGAYEKPTDIPIIAAQRYTFGTFFTAGNPGWVASLNDLPDRVIWANATFANGTLPTVEQYKVIVAAVAGAVPNATTGAYANEIVAEESEVRRWKGNIFERVTRYVRAQ